MNQASLNPLRNMGFHQLRSAQNATDDYDWDLFDRDGGSGSLADLNRMFAERRQYLTQMGAETVIAGNDELSEINDLYLAADRNVLMAKTPGLKTPEAAGIVIRASDFESNDVDVAFSANSSGVGIELADEANLLDGWEVSDNLTLGAVKSSASIKFNGDVKDGLSFETSGTLAEVDWLNYKTDDTSVTLSSKFVSVNGEAGKDLDLDVTLYSLGLDVEQGKVPVNWLESYSGSLEYSRGYKFDLEPGEIPVRGLYSNLNGSGSLNGLDYLSEDWGIEIDSDINFGGDVSWSKSPIFKESSEDWVPYVDISASLSINGNYNWDFTKTVDNAGKVISSGFEEARNWVHGF